MRKLGLMLCSAAAVGALLTACGTTSAVKAQPEAAKAITLADLANTLNSKDNTAKTVKISVDLGSVDGKKTSGTGVMDLSDPASPDMRLDLNTESELMKMVIKDKVNYLSMPSLGSDKPWAKVDEKSTDPMTQVFTKVFEQINKSADPAKTFDLIKDNGTITASKPETVDAVATTHYSAKVDTMKLMHKQLDSALRSMASSSAADKDKLIKNQQKLDKLMNKLPKTLPAEIWINEQRLPVKLQLTTADLGKDPATPDQVTETVSYHDWGKPVTITAPPAGQVEDLSTMFEHLGGR